MFKLFFLNLCRNLELRSSPINIVPYLLFDIQNGKQIRSPDTG